MKLVQLIYVSSAIKKLSNDELDNILESSIRYNQRQQVTGMLLYSDGNFMQVIEGEESKINETYERICEDTRHRNIILVNQETISEREFESWSMSFRRLSLRDAEENPTYAPFFIHGIDAAQMLTQPGLAKALLKQFNQGLLC
jgi:hypothetical protein